MRGAQRSKSCGRIVRGRAKRISSRRSNMGGAMQGGRSNAMRRKMRSKARRRGRDNTRRRSLAKGARR